MKLLKTASVRLTEYEKQTLEYIAQMIDHSESWILRKLARRLFRSLAKQGLLCGWREATA